MQDRNFTGFVLAGGKSSRMGKDKAWLEINGKTFLENAVDVLRPACSSIKIVLNQSQHHFIEKIPDDIPHIFDHFENRGALGGIHAALTDCKTKLAIILAVDLPFVSRQAIEKLCEVALSSKDVAAIVPRQNDGRLQPLCAVYRVQNCLPQLEDLLTKPTSPSVRNFLELIPTNYLEATVLSDENLFFNVNQPSDFALIKKAKLRVS